MWSSSLRLTFGATFVLIPALALISWLLTERESENQTGIPADPSVLLISCQTDRDCDDENPCTRDFCDPSIGCRVVADDSLIPPSDPSGDCRIDVCRSGEITSIINYADPPPDLPGTCWSGRCDDGLMSFVPDDRLCVSKFSCVVGDCNDQGGCIFRAEDSLCRCPAGQVATCAPDDPNALRGCLCTDPPGPTLTCTATPTPARVLEPVQLRAVPSALPNQASIRWEIIQVPTNVDQTAQLLRNADAFQATFTSTAAGPSVSANTAGGAPVVTDYLFQATLRSGSTVVTSCQVPVRILPLDDQLEVTLQMRDALDLDLHVVGGPAASETVLERSMFFHPQRLNTAGTNPARDCFFANCPVCTASLPEQETRFGRCTPFSPRFVDFDQPFLDGAQLSDAQDPQLDIDNRLGCVTSATGVRTCLPEKTTIVSPSAGVYFAWAHLFGNPGVDESGGLTNPASTEATLIVRCRGVEKRYTRQLTSRQSNGLPAAPQSLVRLGGSGVRIEIPTNPSSPCILP